MAATAELVKKARSRMVTRSNNPQRAWANLAVAARLRVMHEARHQLAHASEALVDAISSDFMRTRADSYAAEILPLLAACKFLEREAEAILRSRNLGAGGLPIWLAGIETVVERAPFGTVLIIAPANYPLFLAAAQTLQALAAGNAVVWKPGRGGRAVAEAFACALGRAGLPQGLLRITGDQIDDAIGEIRRRPDKIVFTGSAEAGRSVLRLAAESAIPVVVELSGCDAVFVLPSAEIDQLVDAIAFGLRLNGSATCMAPRRLVFVGCNDSFRERVQSLLVGRFAAIDGVRLDPQTRGRLIDLLSDVERRGGQICGDLNAAFVRPILVLNGSPDMPIAQADIFAPVLTILRAHDTEAAVALDTLCPLALTAAIFGESNAARNLGRMLHVGTVIVNHLIVPTADPRIPFGGRKASGYGATRGAEGLLEMTSAKVVAVNTRRVLRHFTKTTEAHETLFRAIVATIHSGTLRQRFRNVRNLLSSLQHLK